MESPTPQVQLSSDGPWCNKVFKIFTITNISTKYLVMCKVYTDVGGII